ncbi:MAG: terpene cyclase/mutase family protein [Acidobacteriia bacterium]|nr:terpene cyclase/mutase family protein [Terriglobia bacterium]
MSTKLKTVEPGTSSEPSQGVAALVSDQNPDGGWGYGPGESWTEPSAFAILALRASADPSPASARALQWLRKVQRPDGGWAPNPSIEESTWVTAAALLSVKENPGALAWLLQQSGRESGIVHRLRTWMLGVDSGFQTSHDGWPWFPGTSAWVSPTALTVMALSRFGLPQVKARVSEGRQYLLSRMCDDGGWNHGSSRTLGYEASSYPETTGLALLALRGTPNLDRSLRRAEEHLQQCSSPQGLCWLRLGLMAHGRSSPRKQFKCRNHLDIALSLLADAAGSGRNPLLES